MQKRTKLKVMKIVRDLLGKRGGWVKGTSYDVKNGVEAYCVTEACDVALEISRTRSATRARPGLNSYSVQAARDLGLIDYWRRKFPEWRYGEDAQIQDWNDMSSRRKKDVLALVDGYISELEGGK